MLAAGFAAMVAGSASAACTGAAGKTLVRLSGSDYNRGRVAAIDRLWRKEPYFQWFSAAGRYGPNAYDRSTLAQYFRKRVQMHERVVLTKLGAGYDPKPNIVNFGGMLIRSADDLGAAARGRSREPPIAPRLGRS
jgi:hypothetical protein